MSTITSAVLMFSTTVDETPLEDHILSTNITLRDSERFQPVNYKDAGGYKVMEASVYACAFNYLNVDDLQEWFEALPDNDDPYLSAILIYDTNGEEQGFLSRNWGYHGFQRRQA